jgi:hypothetical protein
MSTGSIAYELLAGQAGLLLAAMVTVGLAGWLVTRRAPGPPWRPRLAPAAAGGDPGLTQRLARPVQLPRQLDPDARHGHRPRAPSPVRSAAA